MTQAQVDSAVAEATGEEVGLIRVLGFSLVPIASEEPEPDRLALLVECPFCRRAVPSPGTVGDGSTALAECLDCDVYFDISPDEIFAAAPDEP